MTEDLRTRLACIALILAGIELSMFEIVKGWGEYDLHPLYSIKYNISWYFTFLSDVTRPLIYLIVLALRPNLGWLLYCFIAAEILLIIDFLLNYRQTPMRFDVAILMAIATLVYYYSYYDANKKSDHIRN